MPVEPTREWTLRVSMRRRLGGFGMLPISRTFNLSAVPEVASAADIPGPADMATQWVIRRIAGTGQVVVWARATTASIVSVTLTNSIGQTATRQGTSL